jgi:KUP system potassium uptake protein
MSSTTTVPHKAGLFTLALGSTGVVYGDIGTSPLYALKETLKVASGAGAHSPDLIVSLVSLVLWTLFLTVTVKYVGLIMWADNDREGGILALTALAFKAMGGAKYVVILGMIGAALFYGDAVLTPAVSVLSAVEGLNLVSSAFKPYVVSLALVILISLFVVQSRGTARVATFFGPVMALWFGLMALVGLPYIWENTAILAALNPLHALDFLLHHGLASMLVLGSVFLAVTGAEALYADMGHFGRTPIQVAWIGFIFPCLGLNYLGQGAFLMAHPEHAENPFFLMFPEWALIPMVLLATLATIIAAQAAITGAFSLTQQAIQLKLLPRMVIRPTSETERGQIYVPQINWMLLTGVVMVVLSFRSSEALISAYGIAVSGTMVMTALLAFFVAWKVWRVPMPLAVMLMTPFLALDMVFLSANSLKVFDGGWLPVLFGALLMVAMITWRKGSELLSTKQSKEALDLLDYIPTLAKSIKNRVDGTAVFFTPRPDEVPPALLHNLKHNRVLHQNTVILAVDTVDEPRVEEVDRVRIETLNDGFLRVRLRFGFMEVPNVPLALKQCRRAGWKFEVMKTSFFLSKRTLKVSSASKMPWWQDALFVRMSTAQADASAHFRIPTERAVELGRQVSI